MKPKCPALTCSSHSSSGTKFGPVVSNGSFYRRSDSRKIARYRCLNCGLFFSRATLSPCYRQKKRRINEPLKELLCSGVSQRRAAIILHVHPTTVVRHFRFLANEARKQQAQWLQQYRKSRASRLQFDDLETSEHTKCKPLSVALAIEVHSRKILDFQVARMPARGLLSKVARKKYGYRADQRGQAWDQMMKNLIPYVHEKAEWTSDENPHYPRYLKRHHPEAKHVQLKGARGCVTGQGELKKLKFDPMFTLNHTCAMLRANLNRLFRRTWCISKTLEGLQDHLAIFTVYFNQRLTP